MTTARRRRQWVDILVNEVTSDAEVDEAILLSQSVVPGDSKGLTLVRLIIRLDVVADAIVEASTDIMSVSLGIGLVSGTLGVAASNMDVGSQNDVPASGWLWRTRLLLGEQWQSMYRIEADIRAQRKLLYGEPRLFLSASLNSGTAFAVETAGIVRALYLLP